MKHDKPTLLDWLGLRREPDFSKARWLGGAVTVVIATVLAVLLIGTLIAFLKALFSDDPDAVALRNVGLVLAAMVGIPFLVWRSVVAQKQVDVAEQGHITDRINAAVQGLGADKIVKRPPMRKADGPAAATGDGKPDTAPPGMDEVSAPNLEVRIGSIYALERIAQDSDRDHVQVMEILCAYIRQNAPASLAEPLPDAWREAFESKDGQPAAGFPSFGEIQMWAGKLKQPREDIQVALTVLARRSKRQIALEGHVDDNGAWQGYRIDLRNTCLQRADLRKAAFDFADLRAAQMQGAELHQAQMQKANLRKAQMQGANLHRAQMREAELQSAQMQGAELGGAQMQGAHLEQAQMQRADLRRAQMQGANLSEAQMQGAKFYEVQMDDATHLWGAALHGAVLKDVDYSRLNFTQDQIDSVFGDQTVILPRHLTRPAWPEIAEGNFHEFNRKWRAWQVEIGFDPDKPSTG